MRFYSNRIKGQSYLLRFGDVDKIIFIADSHNAPLKEDLETRIEMLFR